MIRSVLARHLVYPLHERLMKRPTFPYLAELEQSQWLPRDGMVRLQEEKLAKLLHTAHAHCPWHRARMEAAGIDADGPVSLQDLRRLPTMCKQDATLHGDQMVWHGVPGGAFKYNTGGSSGQPLIFFYGRFYKDLRVKANREGWGNRYDFETPPGWEFYDLKRDPFEMDNRYGDPAYTEVIATLKRQLKRLRRELDEEDTDYPDIQKVIDAHWED